MSWFDLHTPRELHKGKSLKHGCRCTAAAVLPLYTDFMAVRLSECFPQQKITPLFLIVSCACDSTHSTHTCLVHAERTQYTQKHRLWLSPR